MKRMLLAVLLCLSLTACGQADAGTSAGAAEPIGSYTAVIDIADYGSVVVELDGDSAPIVGEASANGIDTPIAHTRGTISMARAKDPNSASSQFFLCQADCTFLDGDYAAFGRVTEGMDVVDAVCADAQPTDDNGTIPPEAQPVIRSITIQE